MTTGTTAGSGLGGLARERGRMARLLRAFAARLLQWIDEEIAYRRTVRELQQLSDRELDDLGIARRDIPAIARRAVHRH